MACTVVFNHYATGSELTLELLDRDGVVANGDEPDAMTEPGGKPCRYEATVSESLSGWYTARVIDDLGVLYTGRVKVNNDSGMYLIDDPEAADVTEKTDLIADKQEEQDGRFDELDADAQSIIDDIAVVTADVSTLQSSATTILARIGSFAGTGVNTVLGAFQALFRKDVSAPSDIGGAFSPATESLEALRDSRPENYSILSIDSSGKVAANGEATIPPEAVDEIAEQVIGGLGDGVNISDAGVARLAGTITKWVQPTWSGRGFDKALVVGASYTGDLAPKLVITDWSGASVADATSLILVARRTSGTEVASLEFSLSPQDDVTVSGETTTVHITLTAEQTQSVAAGVYHADLIGEWSNGERHAMVPDGFRVSFREPAREAPKAGNP